MQILAIDVGFGNTKLCWDATRGVYSEFTFKSIAPISLLKQESMTGAGGMDRVGIMVNGTQYLVGPEAVDAGGVATLETNFVGRPQYLALLRGAIYYHMKCSGVVHQTIDALAVGLPVSNYSLHRSALEKLAIGTHTIATPPGLSNSFGDNLNVEVKRVLVLPQPLGALRARAATDSSIADAAKTNLIIDAGFNTFDWLLSRGMRVDIERSGSFEGGVAHILKRVSNQAGKILGVGALDFNEVERALESGELVVNAKKYDFKAFQTVAEAAADAVVDRFMNAQDQVGRIDQIVMTGGGAKFYVAALRRRFPDHKIVADEKSIMSNVRGFYLFAAGLLQ